MKENLNILRRDTDNGRNLGIKLVIRKWNHKQVKNNEMINSSDSKKENHCGDTRWFTWKEHVHSHNKVNTKYLSHKNGDINILGG